MTEIRDEVLAVLSSAECEGSHLRLTGQLDRKLYTDTNKVLEVAGGKWNRKHKAHIFPEDAAEAIEPLLLTGQYVDTKKDFQQFDTPPELVSEVMNLAGNLKGERVLEPSAGIGRLSSAAKSEGAVVDAVEIDAERAKLAHDSGLSTITVGDFMSEQMEAVYSRVIMNPPFSKGQDIAHVRRAYSFLKPGGRLVSIMSPGWTFRNDRKHAEFREWATAMRAEVHHVADGAFQSSGTNVRTLIVVIDKPQEQTDDK
ncbi:methyltransferase [Tritonibacter mobilis]|uniref:methyltransferase n=1 Tax=Tritonibacter mobilis TaxID=379347 RepID=UPI000806DCED|nr:methyltransferase [Tritonibacter mobilis]